MKCIAVDDEPLALELLEEYIKKVSSLELVSTFDNAISTLDFLKHNKIDLLFLDIQMEELSGIQLLHILKNKPLVIFTTAYDKYAIEGYELDVVDYLLKPISFERFIKAVEKVSEKFAPIQQTHDSGIEKKSEDFIFIKTEFKLQKVNLSDVQFIEGTGDYLTIYTPKEKILTLQNFKKMEELLPDSRFCRVHKSYLVSLDKIIIIEKSRIKIGDKFIPISETYRQSFYDKLQRLKMI